MGFLDTLRRPKALGVWADDGRIRAGEPDPAGQAFDFIKQQMRNESNDRAYGVGMRGGGGNLGRIARGQENTRPMNVVYNQAPEMAQKQFNFMKDQAALEQKNKETARADKALAANDEYIQGRRDNEMKQRGMDTNEELARAKLALELGEREKLEIEGRNRLAQIAASNAGNMDVAKFTRDAQERMNVQDNEARIRADEIAAGKLTADNSMISAEEDQNQINQLMGLLGLLKKQPDPSLNGDVNTIEDDKLKLNNAIKKLYKNNKNLADDLTKLADISETNPAMFNMLLNSLRNL